MKLCHFSFEQLLDYQEGRLEAEVAARVRRHLTAGCKRCERDITWIATFVPALNVGLPMQMEVEMRRPSEKALKFVRDLFKTQPASTRPLSINPPGQHNRLPILTMIANLVFDSRLGATGMLVPSREGGRQSVHLVYQAGEIDVDVWQEIDGQQTLCLIGQALPKEGKEPLTLEGASLELHTPDDLPIDIFKIDMSDLGSEYHSLKATNRQATIEDGEFIFEQVTVGNYTLHLQLHDQEISLPDLKVGLGSSQ